jgi:hypothetical protein
LCLVSPAHTRNNRSAKTKPRKHISHNVIGPEGPLNSNPNALRLTCPLASVGGGKALRRAATIAKAEAAAQGTPMFWAVCAVNALASSAPRPPSASGKNAAKIRAMIYPTSPIPTIVIAIAGVPLMILFTEYLATFSGPQLFFSDAGITPDNWVVVDSELPLSGWI